MASKRDYTRDIIDEYNIRLQSWGSSDSWGLTEFKMLEDLIYESSKMRINANTLKRFFQQKTSNPQLATTNALCMFLGYSGYAEFVMKKTEELSRQHDNILPKQEKEADKIVNPSNSPISSEPPLTEEKEENIKSQKKNTKLIYPGILILVLLLTFLAVSWDNIQEKYENHLIKSVVFTSEVTKGASPFTAKIQYYVPAKLRDSISVVCVEANGDTTIKTLVEGQNELYLTYIYPGRGLCHLMYKDRIIRTIIVESRIRGWSTYLKEERNDLYYALPFSSVSTENGYLTLPLQKIPVNAITDKLFVSYTYYKDSIIDGDNFIFETRVRNSATEDNGIPCYDIMMYLFSNTGFHCFALNENCYSYLKFISSENTIMGDHHDLSRFNFNPAVWHIMRIEVKDKKTTFYLDGEEVLHMDYHISLGTVNELTLRFKGCGAVDYVKVMTPEEEVVYEENFLE